MSNIVCKFGGSSLASFDKVKNVANLVKEGGQKYIVLSAPGKRKPGDTKITDCLISIWQKCQKGMGYNREWKFFTKRYLDIKNKLHIDFDLKDAFLDFYSKINSSTYDFVVSRGEYFMALLFAKYTGYHFLDAKDFIVFDDNGDVDIALSQTKFDCLVSSGKRYVIPGFYGATKKGKIKTLSRGGSDITGAVVSVLCKAKLYQNYTDVDGFLDADPKICPRASLIEKLSYGELRELSYTGANVLHQDCVRFLKKNNIVLNLRNTFKPTCKGSLIMPDDMIMHSHITGISGQKGFCALSISKFAMHADKNSYQHIFDAFASIGTPIEHLHSGIDNVCVIVSQKNLSGERLEKAEKALKSYFENVQIIENIALISIVGLGMLKDSALEHKVLDSIYSMGRRVVALNKGAAGLSIILAVQENDYEQAVNELHHSLLQKDNS